MTKAQKLRTFAKYCRNRARRPEWDAARQTGNLDTAAAIYGEEPGRLKSRADEFDAQANRPEAAQ